MITGNDITEDGTIVSTVLKVDGSFETSFTADGKTRSFSTAASPIGALQYALVSMGGKNVRTCDGEKDLIEFEWDGRRFGVSATLIGHSMTDNEAELSVTVEAV